METPIEVGGKYVVRHTRKGRFSVRIDAISGEWIECTIIGGRAGAMLSYNERETGEKITLRDCHCSFTPIGPRFQNAAAK
jgi:hypothetical protein